MGKLRYKCLTCGRKLEPLKEGSAAGPICYPCFWGAKLEHESGITEIDQIPPQLKDMMHDMFTKAGYDFPFELIQSWKDKHYNKFDNMHRWWFPRDERQ